MYTENHKTLLKKTEEQNEYYKDKFTDCKTQYWQDGNTPQIDLTFNAIPASF